MLTNLLELKGGNKSLSLHTERASRCFWEAFFYINFSADQCNRMRGYEKTGQDSPSNSQPCRP